MIPAKMLRATLRWVLSQLGLRIRLIPLDKIHPVELGDSVEDPRTILYYGKRSTASVLIDAPVENGYGLEAFPLSQSGAHPFVRALSRAQQSAEPRAAIYEVLDHYYRIVQPTNAAEWLGLSVDEPSIWATEPAWARIFPWESGTVEERRRGVKARALAENQTASGSLSIDHGWKCFGPVSTQFLAYETQRLYSLFLSIQRNGYRRNNDLDGDIRGIALVDSSGDWTWLQSGGGFHRAATLSALGWKRLPVRIWRVIFREHVDIWPQVVAGLYSRESALEVFDRIIQGRYPSVIAPWCEGSVNQILPQERIH